MLTDYAYENLRRQTYEGGATFVPVCPVCGRFVKADAEILTNGLGEIKPVPNATCKRCGRVKMIFEGWI